MGPPFLPPSQGRDGSLERQVLSVRALTGQGWWRKQGGITCAWLSHELSGWRPKGMHDGREEEGKGPAKNVQGLIQGQ